MIERVKELFSNRRNLLIGFFALAFFLRLAYLVQIENKPFFYELTPGSDMQTYDRVAREVLTGEVEEGDTDLSPFYPYFYLPLNYLAFDLDSPDRSHLFFARLLQCALGALTVLMVVLITERSFGRFAAIIAGFLGSFYSVFIIYDNTLLSESLLNFVCALMVWLVFRAHEKPSARNDAVAALGMALAVVTKPAALVFIPALFIWQYFARRQKKDSPGEANVLPGRYSTKKRVALVLGILIAVIFPFVLKNYMLTGHFSLLRQSGYLFLMGNNETATGMHDYPTGKALEEYDRRTKGMSKPDSNREAFYMALEFARENPAEYLALLWRKARLFWGALEIPNNLSVEYYRRTTMLGLPVFIGFGFLLPAALLGFVFSLSRWRDHLFLYLCVLFYSLAIIAYLVVGRYRLAIVPFMLPFAAFGIQKLWMFFRLREGRGWWTRWKKPAMLFALFLVMLVTYNRRALYDGIFPYISPRGNYVEKPDHVVIRDDDGAYDYYATTLDTEDDILKKDLFLDRNPLLFKKATLAVRVAYEKIPQFAVNINGVENVFSFKDEMGKSTRDLGRWESIPIKLDLLKKGNNTITVRLVSEKNKNGAMPWLKVFVDDTFDFDRSECSLDGGPWRKDHLDLKTFRKILTHHIPRGEYLIRLVLQ